jgi:hypothetical protein
MTQFTDGDLAGLTWSVSWEDADRPDAQLYLAVPKEFEGLLSPNAHVALLGVLPTAARYGESRIATGAIDPWLLEGLDVVQTYYQLWQNITPVRIEPAAVQSAPKLQADRGTAMFLSGGVDSLATLKRNIDQFPLGHPGRVTHAFHVDLSGPQELADLGGGVPKREVQFIEALGAAARAAEIEAVPVVTNLRSLDGYEFNVDWMFHSHGTVLAAVAHAFDSRFRRLLLASSYDAAHLSPWGSHPLIDGHLSSTALAMAHHNEQYSRQEKVAIIAEWTEALPSLDVCFEWFDRAAGARNCGECEKCQRTIAGLLIAGVDPAETGAFERTRLDAQTLRPFGRFADEYERAAWTEIESGLRGLGHPAADAVASRIRRDRLAQMLNNRATRPLLAPAKAGYGLVRKMRAR